MRYSSVVSAFLAVGLAVAAPNPVPVAKPVPVPVAAPVPMPAADASPEADPQWWNDIAAGISQGITTGVANGVAAGISNPFNIPGAIATGIASGVQTGWSQSLGNLIGNAQPGYCGGCQQVACTGVNACQCQNVATLSCWVSSNYRCARPQIATCGNQLPTGSNNQYASCARGLPPCAAGYTCDRSFTTGCVDLTNSGSCIGICVPQFAF